MDARTALRRTCLQYVASDYYGSIKVGDVWEALVQPAMEATLRAVADWCRSMAAADDPVWPEGADEVFEAVASACYPARKEG